MDGCILLLQNHNTLLVPHNGKVVFSCILFRVCVPFQHSVTSTPAPALQVKATCSSSARHRTEELMMLDGLSECGFCS